jgi:hypothetical protein
MALPTGGGHSVGVVCSWARATELVFFSYDAYEEMLDVCVVYFTVLPQIWGSHVFKSESYSLL